MKMMDCPNRHPGQVYCDVCPHRPAVPVCLDPMMPDARPRPKSSMASRVCLFVISAVAIALLPVVFRNVSILSHDVTTIGPLAIQAITTISLVAGVCTLIGAFYGLYAALWRPDGKKSA